MKKRELLQKKIQEFTEYLEENVGDDPERKKRERIERLKSSDIESIVSTLVSANMPPGSVSALISKSIDADEKTSIRIGKYVALFFDILNAWKKNVNVKV